MVHFCRHISVAAVVVLAGATAGPLAAQSPSYGTANTEVSSDTVTLDLAVRDRHNKPVLDLRPEELSITDNGTPVKLTDLHLVDGKGQDEPLITFIFERPGMHDTHKGSDDFLFGRSPIAARETSRQLRTAATKFLKGFPSAGVRFAVVDVWGRLQIQQAFTTDRKAVTKAISAAVDPEVYGTRVAANAEEKRQIQIAKTGQDSSREDLSTRDRVLARSMYTAMQASSHIARDQHLPLSLACLLALVESQQAVPGRKAIVYFATNDESGGDSNTWLSQDSHAKSAIHSIVGAANRAGANIYVVLPDEVGDTDQLSTLFSTAGMGMSPFGGGADISAAGSPMMDTTNLAMASVASRKPSASSAQENLNTLARQSGGNVINANGRMSGHIKDLLLGLTTYYEASFVPPSHVEDGSFHATAFKTSRHGLRMRARSGYLALPPSVGITTPPQPFELPLMALLKRTELPRDVDYRAAVLNMGRQEEGNVGLVALEVPVSGLEVREDPSTHLNSAHVSVLATINDSSGMEIERFSEDIARRWSASKNSATAPEVVSFERSFSAPPGKYVLATAITDWNSGKAAAKRETFEVSSSKSMPGLGDLMLVRGTEPIGDNGSDPDLLWRGGERVLPNLYGQLPPGVHNLSVFFFASTDPKSTEPAAVRLEVLRDGVALRGKPLISTLKAGAVLTPVVKSFAISSAADGDYEVRATVTQGGRSAESTGTFSLSGGEEQIASAGTADIPLNVDPPGLAADQPAADGLSQEESDRILADVRRNALTYSDTLPNLICQQTTTRLIDAHGKGDWRMQDKIVEVLTYVDHRENRTVMSGEVNHAKKDEKTMSQFGMISTGEFGVALSNIFKPSSQAVFTRKGLSMLHGEQTEEFDYRITQENSSFALTIPNDTTKVSYHGRVYVDRATHGVRSITIIADDVPKKFPIRSAAVRVDYDYVAINDHDYLLPVSAQVVAGQGRNKLERNDLQFSNFRKFGSNARMLTTNPQGEPK
jgi:VWFA-related protein